MFGAFKLSFVLDILAFFGLETIWATFLKHWAFFKIFWSTYFQAKPSKLGILNSTIS
jgi:hypothetical protein